MTHLSPRLSLVNMLLHHSSSHKSCSINHNSLSVVHHQIRRTSLSNFQLRIIRTNHSHHRHLLKSNPAQSHKDRGLAPRGTMSCGIVPSVAGPSDAADSCQGCSPNAVRCSSLCSWPRFSFQVEEWAPHSHWLSYGFKTSVGTPATHINKLRPHVKNPAMNQ